MIWTASAASQDKTSCTGNEQLFLPEWELDPTAHIYIEVSRKVGFGPGDSSMTEWDAADYARISGLQQAMAEEVLALLDLNGSRADSRHRMRQWEGHGGDRPAVRRDRSWVWIRPTG